MGHISQDNYTKDKYYPRVVSAVNELGKRAEPISPVDLLVKMGLLPPRQLARWRQGQVPFLERAITCKLSKIGRIFKILEFHAQALGLQAIQRKAKKGRRYSSSGNAQVESRYLRAYRRPLQRQAGRPTQNAGNRGPSRVRKTQSSTGIEIYTDGACADNPGRGGWAAIIRLPDQKAPVELRGDDADTTNNRMELTAAIEGLRHFTETQRLTVFTDSKYLRDGMKNDWIADWASRNWKRSNGDPVLNADLWQELQSVAHGHEVRWKLVKAHVGNRWNTRADRLARSAVPSIASLAMRPNVVHLFAAGRKSMQGQTARWSAVLRCNEHRRRGAGNLRRGSEHRMHLLAVSNGLRRIQDRSLPVYVFTTSSYVYRGVRFGIAKWQQNSWHTQSGTEVQNQDLWQQIIATCQGRQVSWLLIEDSKHWTPDMRVAHELVSSAERDARKVPG